jgi:hypothetical protein
MGDLLDFPAQTAITISFPDHGGKTVQLKARDLEQNEDEDGRANMRGGKTNYFIFPGDRGDDASWLVGLSWRGVIKVSFSSDNFEFGCDPFVLVPHSVLES